MIINKAILIYTLISYVFSRKICPNQNDHLKYNKARTCYRSNQIMISSAHVDSLEDCFKFANRKKALAINFSPSEAVNFLPVLRRNCEVLGCPENGKTKSLVQDLAYDYYSAYGMTNGEFSKNITLSKEIYKKLL